MIYENEFNFSSECFDNKGNVRPFYILDVFEKSATAHGEIIGVGEEKMSKKNLYWIISRIKYQVLNQINPCETYIIRTWSLKPTKLNFQREYLILTKDGKEVIKGTANWLTIDRTDRKLVIGADVFPKMDFCDKVNFSDKVQRLRDFENAEFKMKIIPNKNHIDSNGHVNNKHYTTFMEEALGGFFGKIKTFQIDYIAEIMESDELSVFAFSDNEKTLVKGESDKRNFIAKIEF